MHQFETGDLDDAVATCGSKPVVSVSTTISRIGFPQLPHRPSRLARRGNPRDAIVRRSPQPPQGRAAAQRGHTTKSARRRFSGSGSWARRIPANRLASMPRRRMTARAAAAAAETTGRNRIAGAAGFEQQRDVGTTSGSRAAGSGDKSVSAVRTIGCRMASSRRSASADRTPLPEALAIDAAHFVAHPGRPSRLADRRAARRQQPVHDRVGVEQWHAKRRSMLAAVLLPCRSNQ